MPVANQDDVRALGQALFARVEVDQAIASSWLTIALQRDSVGDFARGMRRLPAIVERIE